MLKTSVTDDIIVSAELQETDEDRRKRQVAVVSTIPKDPYMLLSYVNTQLRDHYDSLEEMCHALDVDVSAVIDVLSGIGYTYEADQNCFRS